MEAQLLDKVRAPDDAAFRAAVGSAADLWTGLDRWLAQVGAARLPSWGGMRTGWELRYRRAGRPLITVTPTGDAFTACIVLGVAVTAEAAALPLGPETRRILDGARRYPDGTWLFIPVRDADGLADVRALLELKLPTSVQRALAGAV